MVRSVALLVVELAAKSFLFHHYRPIVDDADPPLASQVAMSFRSLSPHPRVRRIAASCSGRRA